MKLILIIKDPVVRVISQAIRVSTCYVLLCAVSRVFFSALSCYKRLLDSLGPNIATRILFFSWATFNSIFLLVYEIAGPHLLYNFTYE